MFLLCVQKQEPTVHTVQITVKTLQVPLLDWFLTCPLLCNVVHSLCVEVVDFSVVAQMQIPLVPLKLMEILQLQFIVRCLLCRLSSFWVQSVRRQSCSNSCSPLSMDIVVAMPVVVQRQLPGGSDVRKLRRSRSCSSFERGRCPCCAGGHLGSSNSWTRSLTCPLCSTTVLL